MLPTGTAAAVSEAHGQSGLRDCMPEFVLHVEEYAATRQFASLCPSSSACMIKRL